MYWTRLFILFGFALPAVSLAANKGTKVGDSCESFLLQSVKLENPLESKFLYEVHEIEEGLFISGSPKSAEAVAELGVTQVVNVASDSYLPYWENLPSSIRYISIPFRDGFPVRKEVMESAVMELIRARRSGHKVLVHCVCGISRSPTVVALYLMATYGVNWEEAVKRLQGVRNCVKPNLELISSALREEIVRSVRESLPSP